MNSPVDPMRDPGRWLVTTASGAMHLIESAGPGGTVTATRVTAGPAGDDPRYPLGSLRRDGETLTVTGVQHLTGATMANGIVVGLDMWMYLEPLDPAADLTLRRTAPVVEGGAAPPSGVRELTTSARRKLRLRAANGRALRVAAQRRLLGDHLASAPDRQGASGSARVSSIKLHQAAAALAASRACRGLTHSGTDSRP
jgi:hypothetical protein